MKVDGVVELLGTGLSGVGGAEPVAPQVKTGGCGSFAEIFERIKDKFDWPWCRSTFIGGKKKSSPAPVDSNPG